MLEIDIVRPQILTIYVLLTCPLLNCQNPYTDRRGRGKSKNGAGIVLIVNEYFAAGIAEEQRSYLSAVPASLATLTPG